MIIKYPTALYNTILPGQNQSGNVTYTISNNNPPKSKSTFLQLPRSEEIRKSPSRIYTKYENRKFVGNLVFNITVPTLATEGSGIKTFEIGQFLDFSNEDIENPDPYSLNSIELRQDTNVVNYSKYGLSKDEYNNLVKIAEKKMDDINNQINIIATNLNNNKENISSNQSDINESTKLYNNIILVLGVESTEAKKVKFKIDHYNEYATKLLSEREILLSTLDTLRNDLSNVREVVR
jgi:hypothetical protein